MPSQGALAGTTVLDVSRLLPGPLCSMMLADHGARVIAVSRPDPEEKKGFLEPLYRNKEHVTLDLKAEQGKQIFLELAQEADVIVEGFRPGVVKRLGIDYPAIRPRNPAVIYCAITGYGQTGPLRDQAGHDINFLSLAGVLDLIGPAGGPPVIPGIQIADVAGALQAVIGILLALHARAETGKGQYVDISMTDATVALFLPMALELRRRMGRTPPRGDHLLSHRYACYNLYETADGRYLTIGAMENRFWTALCRHLGLPHFGPLQFDEDRREEILDVMRDAFKQKTLREWQEDLTGLDACWAPVNDLEEVLHEPLFQERHMVVPPQQGHSTGSVTVGIPVKLSDTPGRIRTPTAHFGGHTMAILKELGYSRKDIEALQRRGVI